MKKKIYIAGKVSGEKIHKVSLKFGIAEGELKTIGFDVLNPLAIVNNWHCPWQPAMKMCIKALMGADAVLLLPDWEDSRGALLEARLCKELGIPIFHTIKEIKKWSK